MLNHNTRNTFANLSKMHKNTKEKFSHVFLLITKTVAKIVCLVICFVIFKTST